MAGNEGIGSFVSWQNVLLPSGLDLVARSLLDFTSVFFTALFSMISSARSAGAFSGGRGAIAQPWIFGRCLLS